MGPARGRGERQLWGVNIGTECEHRQMDRVVIDISECNLLKAL